MVSITTLSAIFMSVIKLNTFILSLVMLATITQSALLPKTQQFRKKINFFNFQPLACSMLPFLSATNQNGVELSAFRMSVVILTAIIQSVVLPKHHSSEKNSKKSYFFSLLPALLSQWLCLPRKRSDVSLPMSGDGQNILHKRKSKYKDICIGAKLYAMSQLMIHCLG